MPSYHNMLSTLVSLIVLILSSSTKSTNAAEIVVFVHGLAGFGDDELGPLDYWAETDEFRQQGFTVFTASVGPVSSIHDRACELFAQIKGTRVDYGEVHSNRYGHNRFGKDYTGKGFFPEWSPTNRIHFVGHSLGGSTLLEMERYLQEGNQEEIDAGSTNPLFNPSVTLGGNNWIKTLVTVSTPHNGTPLVEILGDGLIELIKDLIVAFAGFVDTIPFADLIYDFDLDHFNLNRNSGESLGQYMDRIFNAPIWEEGFRDLAVYDLTPEGMYDLQDKRQQAYDGTFYFAYATERTYPFWECKFFFNCQWIEKSDLTMFLFLQPFGNLIGGRDTPADLRKNDGLVPVDSSKGPSLKYGGVGREEYNGNWRDGKWYYQVVSNRDHLQVIGLTLGLNTGLLAGNAGLYTEMARRMKAVSGGSALLAQSADVSDPVTTTAADDEIVINKSLGYVLVGLAGVGLVSGFAAMVVVFRQRSRYGHRSQGAADGAVIVPSPRARKARNPKNLMIQTNNPAWMPDVQQQQV